MYLEMFCKWYVVLIFSVGFFVNTVGIRSVREEFKRWGLPQWVRIMTGVTEGIIALTLIFDFHVSLSMIVATIIMISASATLLINGEFNRLILPVSLGIASIIIFFEVLSLG